MMFTVGQIVGGLIPIAILTLIFRLILKRFLTGYALVWACVGLAFLVGQILYAFGSADGGDPQWTAGFIPYAIAALIVGGIWSWRVSKSSNVELNG